MATVDVVVVAYNSRDELRGCVEPLARDPAVQVIVVDNASPDRSLEVVEDGELPELPPTTEIQLMWIVQEALNNVRNHAAADSATVRFSTEDAELVVSIDDDGCGFTPERRARTGWPHFGLQTMRERAEAVGGRFEIESRPEGGTQVRVRLPLPQSNGGTQ